jgi:hypothetical protein
VTRRGSRSNAQVGDNERRHHRHRWSSGSSEEQFASRDSWVKDALTTRIARVRPDIDQVRGWASLLAGETRGPAWTRDFYVCPPEVSRLARQIDSITCGLIGLVGAQGIGKSSALMALYRGIPGTLCPESDKVLFKWRSGQALYESFLDFTNDSRRPFQTLYLSELVEELYARSSKLNEGDKKELLRFEEGVQYFNEHPNVPHVAPSNTLGLRDD